MFLSFIFLLLEVPQLPTTLFSRNFSWLLYVKNIVSGVTPPLRHSVVISQPVAPETVEKKGRHFNSEPVVARDSGKEEAAICGQEQHTEVQARPYRGVALLKAKLRHLELHCL